MKIPNIKLGFNKSKYSHNLSRDCNTTFPFGVVQPIFTQYLLPNSDIKVNAKQLVRLAPMPVPSFARVSLRTVTRFVPEVDVVPYADSFYSRLPYKGKVFDKLPVVDNPTLLAHLFNLSNFTLYHYSTSGGYTGGKFVEISDTTTDIASSTKDAFNKLFRSDGKPTAHVNLSTKDSRYVTTKTATPLRPLPTPENADYIVFFGEKVGSNQTLFQYCACFNFGFKAKVFRNICLGLGYSLELDDFTPVRLSPLLSFYRAYYDTFGLTRFKAFTETKCFELINTAVNDSVFDQTFTLTKGAYIDELTDFFNELSECYYSASQDFVSMHRDSFAPGSSALAYPFYVDDSTKNQVSSTSNDVPSLNFSQHGGNLTTISLQVLQRLSRFVNKNSVLGRRLTDYMKLHYGTEKISSIFEDSNFVSSSVLNCAINDVFSTSDTAQFDSTTNTKTGENLGAFAGKGLGFGDLSFRFSSKCHGYLITLAAIVPDSGYFQGNSSDLYAVSWEQQPSADFDALGFEATPRGTFITHNSISNRALLPVSDLTDKTFGFVPRFSGFKFAKNVVNGDMSRRGSLDSMSPYYLDHIITSQQVYARQVGVTDDTDKQSYFDCSVVGSPVPSSSYDWRYVCKYPWLGNFLRLFINDTGNLVKGSYLPSDVESKQYPLYCLDDPFICQIAFKVSVSNCLKPLSLSFDTFEESSDNASKDVDPS